MLGEKKPEFSFKTENSHACAQCRYSDIENKCHTYLCIHVVHANVFTHNLEFISVQESIATHPYLFPYGLYCSLLRLVLSRGTCVHAD